MNYEWLKKLKKGDKVIAVRGNRSQIAIVECNDKTNITLKNVNYPFSKEDGRSMTTMLWDNVHIIEATPDNLAMVAEYERREQALKVMYDSTYKRYEMVTTDQLVRIAAILAEKQS